MADVSPETPACRQCLGSFGALSRICLWAPAGRRWWSVHAWRVRIFWRQSHSIFTPPRGCWNTCKHQEYVYAVFKKERHNKMKTSGSISSINFYDRRLMFTVGGLVFLQRIGSEDFLNWTPWGADVHVNSRSGHEMFRASWAFEFSKIKNGIS